MKENVKENEISFKIRKGVFNVYKTFGPGLLETIYEAALFFELQSLGLEVQKQVGIPVIYKGENLDIGFRLDLLVNNLVIIEVKSVEELNEVHHKQLITYLKLAKKKLGLLINFGSADLSKGIIRKVNGL